MKINLSRLSISQEVYLNLKRFQSMHPRYTLSFIVEVVLQDALIDSRFLENLLDDETLFRLEDMEKEKGY